MARRGRPKGSKNRRPRDSRGDRTVRDGGPDQPVVRTPIPIPGTAPSSGPGLVSLDGGKKRASNLREHSKTPFAGVSQAPPLGSVAAPPFVAQPIMSMTTLPMVGLWQNKPSVYFPFKRRLEVPAMESLEERETREQQEVLLHAIFQHGNPTRAMLFNEIPYSRHKRWSDEYTTTYGEAVKLAQQEHKEVLAAELVQRGLVGYLEPVLHQGRPVIVTGPDGQPQYLMKRVASDLCLVTELNASYPEKYKYRTTFLQDASKKVAEAGTPDESEAGYGDLTKLPQEDLAKIREILSKDRTAQGA